MNTAGYRELYKAKTMQDATTATILACKLQRERTKLNLCLIDFCDSQGGKGPCDRKAAHIMRELMVYTSRLYLFSRPLSTLLKNLKWEVDNNGNGKENGRATNQGHD